MLTEFAIATPWLAFCKVRTLARTVVKWAALGLSTCVGVLSCKMAWHATLLATRCQWSGTHPWEQFTQQTMDC